MNFKNFPFYYIASPFLPTFPCWTFLNLTRFRKSLIRSTILMVFRWEQRTTLEKSKALQNFYSDFWSDNWCGQTLCLKMNATFYLGRRKYMFFVYHLTCRPDCLNRPWCHFSTSPRSVLCRHEEKTNVLLEMWPHGADEFKKLEWKLPQNIAKWADLAKPKLFKNPPKIQFWSDFKLPKVKKY